MLTICRVRSGVARKDNEALMRSNAGTLARDTVEKGEHFREALSSSSGMKGKATKNASNGRPLSCTIVAKTTAKGAEQSVACKAEQLQN